MAAERDRLLAVALGKKQYNTNLKTVMLLKDTDFASFKEAIELAAYTCEWDSAVLDFDSIDPIPDDPEAKFLVDTKYAFALLKNRTKGSPVEDILIDVKMGDAMRSDIWAVSSQATPTWLQMPACRVTCAIHWVMLEWVLAMVEL